MVHVQFSEFGAENKCKQCIIVNLKCKNEGKKGWKFIQALWCILGKVENYTVKSAIIYTEAERQGT